LIVLAGVDVIFAVVVALLFTVWKEDADKKDLDSELQRINKARPSVSQNTANPIQPTAKLPESGSEESDEEEEEDEDSEEEDDEEESDEEEEEDEEDSDNSGSSSGGQQRPAMIAKPSNTGLQAASSEGSEGSSGSEQSSSEGSSGSGSSESS
jgi:Mg-chelatase subunit ChlI